MKGSGVGFEGFIRVWWWFWGGQATLEGQKLKSMILGANYDCIIYQTEAKWFLIKCTKRPNLWSWVYLRGAVCGSGICDFFEDRGALFLKIKVRLISIYCSTFSEITATFKIWVVFFNIYVVFLMIGGGLLFSRCTLSRYQWHFLRLRWGFSFSLKHFSVINHDFLNFSWSVPLNFYSCSFIFRYHNTLSK